MPGCGGGSAGSTAAPGTLSGVAAVGYPIVNGAVQVKCADGNTFYSETSSTGTWQVTLSGQILPCALEVSGGTINGAANNILYHSFASSPDTANITPLTDLTVANLAGTATPDAWFAGLTGETVSTISTDAVNTALIKLHTALSGLAPLNKINPITATFMAAPGDPGDDMLAALQTAMTDTGVSYPALLGSAPTDFSTTIVTNLNTALPAAYANTISGSSLLSVTSFTPASGAAGTPITITGANFSATAANNTVKFNGVPADVTSATTSQLVVKVPATATSGTITVAAGNQTTTSTIGFTIPPGTAAQYFTKTAVNNTWSWLRAASGQSSTQTYTRTITDYTSGVVTSSETFSWYPGIATIFVDQTEATTKAWVSKNNSTGIITTELPETFSVGTSFVWQPDMGHGALNATIVAFNVTRTVPAGKFTDCLQVNVANPNATDTLTYYLSPMTGTMVEVTHSSSGMIIFTDQLQSYTAN